MCMGIFELWIFVCLSDHTLCNVNWKHLSIQERAVVTNNTPRLEHSTPYRILQTCLLFSNNEQNAYTVGGNAFTLENPEQTRAKTQKTASLYGFTVQSSHTPHSMKIRVEQRKIDPKYATQCAWLTHAWKWIHPLSSPPQNSQNTKNQKSLWFPSPENQYKARYEDTRRPTKIRVKVHSFSQGHSLTDFSYWPKTN